ncbi:peptidylprolyl isomerase [Streptomyces sp. NPDC020965]|uniref:peptidylprolyl isomerase n=1 Tax=Streptomyces sp. NPDC020965 TaxID=3365105 RepID=UPI0037B49D44
MTNVLLTTTLGEIELSLDEEKAPNTVKNFLEYVDAGFYDDTVFDRVIPGMLAQAGCYTDKMTPKPTRGPVLNESGNGLTHARGTVAMGHRALSEATSQFFINLADNTRVLAHSRPGHAVFATVVRGIDVADAISSVQTTNKLGMDSVPVQPIHITSAKRVG